VSILFTGKQGSMMPGNGKICSHEKQVTLFVSVSTLPVCMQSLESYWEIKALFYVSVNNFANLLSVLSRCFSIGKGIRPVKIPALAVSKGSAG